MSFARKKNKADHQLDEMTTASVPKSFSPYLKSGNLIALYDNLIAITEPDPHSVKLLKVVLFSLDDLEKPIPFATRINKLLLLPYPHVAVLSGLNIIIYRIQENNLSNITSIPLPKDINISVSSLCFFNGQFIFCDRAKKQICFYNLSQEQWHFIKAPNVSPEGKFYFYPFTKDLFLVGASVENSFLYLFQSKNNKILGTIAKPFYGNVGYNFISPDHQYAFFTLQDNKTKQHNLYVYRINWPNLKNIDNSKFHFIVMFKNVNANSVRWLPDSSLLFLAQNEGLKIADFKHSTSRLVYQAEKNEILQLIVLPNGQLVFFTKDKMICLMPHNMIMATKIAAKRLEAALNDTLDLLKLEEDKEESVSQASSATLRNENLSILPDMTSTHRDLDELYNTNNPDLIELAEILKDIPQNPSALTSLILEHIIFDEEIAIKLAEIIKDYALETRITQDVVNIINEYIPTHELLESAPASFKAPSTLSENVRQELDALYVMLAANAQNLTFKSEEEKLSINEKQELAENQKCIEVLNDYFTNKIDLTKLNRQLPHSKNPIIQQLHSLFSKVIEADLKKQQKLFKNTAQSASDSSSALKVDSKFKPQ